MNSVAILLSLAFWAWLWGIAGAAIVVIVTIKVFCNHIEGLSGLGEFLSERQAIKNGATEGDMTQTS